MSSSLQIPKALADYACTSPHCYGINTWWGGTFGAHTSILTVPISSINKYSRINNEMWLAQNEYGTIAWTEAGYVTHYVSPTYTEPDFFWAKGELDGSVLVSYEEHDLSPVWNFNEYVTFHIENELPQGYGIYISGRYVYFADNTASVYLYNEPPNVMQIGQELSGTSSASSQMAHFIHNEWIDFNHTPMYQHVNGDLWPSASRGPVQVDWTIKPTNSTTGGDLWTSCGC